MTEAASTTQTDQQSSSQQSQSQSTGQDSGGGSQTTQTQAASRPEWLPDAHWDATAGAIKPEFADHFKQLTELHTAHTARLAARPEKPDGYELKFSDGFTPEIAVEFHPDDPRVAPLREFAHKNNWTQAEFSEALQIEAAKVAAETKAYNDVVAAETRKLGANATARVTELRTWLAGVLGPAGADDILGTKDRNGLLIFSADAIGHLEKLKLAFSSQGGAGINGNGREPPAPPPHTPEARLYPQQARKAS